MLAITKRVTLGMAVMIGGLLCAAAAAEAVSPMMQQMAVKSTAAPSTKAGEGEAAVPGKMSGVDVEAIMYQMTDEQVRRLLIEKLREDALKQVDTPAKPAEIGFLTRFILWVQNGIVRFRDRVHFLMSGAFSASGDLPQSIADLTDGKGFRPFFVGLLRVAAVFFAAWLVNWIYRRRTAALNRRIETTPIEADWRLKAARATLRTFLDLVSIAIFVVVTLLIYFTFFEDNLTRRSFLLTYLTALSLVGLLRLISRMILSPFSPALRVLPLNDETATYLYHWMTRIAVVGVFGWLTAIMLRMQKINEALVFFLVVFVGLAIALMIMRMILQQRQPVADMLLVGVPPTSLRALSAGIWHVLAIAYVFVFWSGWVLSLLVLGDRATLAGVATILVVPLFFFFDWIAGRLVSSALGLPVAHAAAGQAPSAEPAAAETPVDTEQEDEVEELDDIRDDAIADMAEAQAAVRQSPKAPKWSLMHTYRMLRRGFRIAIAALLFFWILGVWGIELPIAQSVTKSVLRILLTVVIGYVVWEMISVFIERKLKTMKTGPEGGGAGGNRFRTLMQLARKFIMVVLFTMVSLIVLSSLGIEIGPLLAGAGVVGLAIGFGSQALVKDIVAGIFFLMDDAFRIGDYIEVGSAKGVVEHISIRSLRLRHHRGMVYTIPFGGLKEVKNLTRDWVIMKLKYRVPYDTDVDKVRKIVKKINKKIMADEEMGPMLLGKVKSQGVAELDDSAMIMRIKFTTKPGEQFMIRKEVYKLLREEFKKAGIEFATRQVMVHMPPEFQGNPAAQQAAAAAAEAVVAAEEAAAPAGKK